MPTPQLLHTLASAGGPLGIAALIICGLIGLAKAIAPHVAAVLAQRQRLRTSRYLADAHPHHRIEITPDMIVIVPKDGPARSSSPRGVASLVPDPTTRTAIASKRKPS
jgi:hypothetical protein